MSWRGAARQAGPRCGALPMTVLLEGARIVTPTRVLDPGWVEVAGDRIAAVGPGGTSTGLTVVPGFVDIHVHGGGGASFLTADRDEAARAVEFHRRHGTTTTLASLLTAPPDILEGQLSALADLCADGLLAGIHLEGPWLSDVRRGAHDPAFLRPPALPEVRRLLAAGGSALRMVTLAPELDGGLDAVRAVVAADAVAAVGHTDATYEVARASIDAGARLGTHLFNGMRPVHHREPGPVVALLEDDRVAIEPGRRADLVVLDEKLEVVAVMARGAWVEEPP